MPSSRAKPPEGRRSRGTFSRQLASHSWKQGPSTPLRFGRDGGFDRVAAVTDRLEYDATGLLCPLPVLRANRKMRELEVGGLLTVRATDPAAEQDFPAYCRQTGHELVSAGRDGDVLVFVIRKKA